ncbi:MAG: hypothetical protein ACC614_02165 [Methanobacterium formicicum]|uniref:hypothetical protein n=1 Tax=Methanobacterium formicicum TaxID=2162 RepID=UPI003530EF98
METKEVKEIVGIASIAILSGYALFLGQKEIAIAGMGALAGYIGATYTLRASTLSA